jgi:adenosylcobinamide-GDP ribazoletransferase
MTILRSIAMALTLFSRLPMPTLDWQRGNMRYALAALPLVGVLIALLLQAWLWLSNWLGFGPLLLAAGLTLLPVLISGGIHLDGYCDTADALASRAEPARKREILKDPHAGAFAAIAVAAYLVLYFALAAELPRSTTVVGLLGCATVASRGFGALAALSFPSVKNGGLLNTLQGNSSKAAVLICIIWLVAAYALAAWLSWQAALALMGAALLVVLYVRIMAVRQFGGISGDLIGFLIQLAEIAALIALVVCGLGKVV